TPSAAHVQPVEYPGLPTCTQILGRKAFAFSVYAIPAHQPVTFKFPAPHSDGSVTIDMAPDWRMVNFALHGPYGARGVFIGGSGEPHGNADFYKYPTKKYPKGIKSDKLLNPPIGEFVNDLRLCIVPSPAKQHTK
ncbi:hypothetical protein AB0N17_45260, partial [Streptomyces sp. NPDC051133]|uniref:hypothetical protein n=1 Tax=Streptomyces sp. NPDC051133 TaxID=3155521 RepID=UPI003447503B